MVESAARQRDVLATVKRARGYPRTRKHLMPEASITFPQRYSGALCITSSSLSIVGALSLFVCYLRKKSASQAVTSRTLVMCIAFSDFFTAAGYLVMASFYANSGVLGETQNLTTVFANHSTLVRLCSGQSFVTTTSSMWSFWWTAILAFHLNLGFVWHKWAWCRRLLPLYCTCAWTIPLILTIPALATGWLGLGCGKVSVTWCFVGVKNLDEGCNSVTHSVLEAVEGKVWEVSAFVLISGLYLHIWCQLVYSRQKRSDPESTPLQKVHTPQTKDWTVLLIPVVFLLIRVWGTARYFLSLFEPSMVGIKVDSVLEVLQAIFDPSQGWTNALIFLLLSNRSLRMFHTLKANAQRKMAKFCCCQLQSHLHPCAVNDFADKCEDQISYKVLTCNQDNNYED